MINRREFLLSGASLVFSSLLPFKASAGTTQPILISACQHKSGLYYGAAVTLDGQVIFAIPLPERVHDCLYIEEKNSVIFFGRSPSQHCYIVDFSTKYIVATMTTRENHHYYGHGVFQKETGRLYLTENNYKTGQGIIGIYNVNDDYRRVGAFFSYGVGPHQLGLLSDQKTLVVANGGLLTHPGLSEEALNLDSFESSLTYIDTQNGARVDQFFCPDRQNSLRHIALDSQDRVFIGAQAYSEDTPPLIYVHGGEDNLQAMEADELTWLRHKDYTASLAVVGDTLAVTSPRGNVISLWDTQSNQCSRIINSHDVAGVCVSSDNTFVATSGFGAIKQLSFFGDGTASENTTETEFAWDNHAHIIPSSVLKLEIST